MIPISTAERESSSRTTAKALPSYCTHNPLKSLWEVVALGAGAVRNGSQCALSKGTRILLQFSRYDNALNHCPAMGIA